MTFIHIKGCVLPDNLEYRSGPLLDFWDLTTMKTMSFMPPKIFLLKIDPLYLILAKLIALCVPPKLSNIHSAHTGSKASPLSRYESPKISVKTSFLLNVFFYGTFFKIPVKMEKIVCLSSTLNLTLGRNYFPVASAVERWTYEWSLRTPEQSSVNGLLLWLVGGPWLFVVWLRRPDACVPGAPLPLFDEHCVRLWVSSQNEPAVLQGHTTLLHGTRVPSAYPTPAH